MTKNELIKALLDKYGDMQMLVAMEELSELQKEISKAIRGKLNKDCVAEEIADVIFCIEQIMEYYDVSWHDVDRHKINKIERTTNRYLNNEL